MKHSGNSNRWRSQGAPKIFRAPTYRAHFTVFAIAQLSHEVPHWLYISKFTRLRARRFPGDSTALVLQSGRNAMLGSLDFQSLTFQAKLNKCFIFPVLMEKHIKTVMPWFHAIRLRFSDCMTSGVVIYFSVHPVSLYISLWLTMWQQFALSEARSVVNCDTLHTERCLS